MRKFAQRYIYCNVSGVIDTGERADVAINAFGTTRSFDLRFYALIPEAGLLTDTAVAFE
jgi:hypothetical protein